MSALDIRRYDPADADAIWDLHVRALSDAGAYDEAFSHRDADLREIEREYNAAGGEFLVGERDGAILAMGGFQPSEDDPDTAVLRRMRVDPDHHRSGYGTAILAALESRIADRGFDRIVLDTTPAQDAAIAFYEHHGYERFRSETVAGREILFYEKALEADP